MRNSKNSIYRYSSWHLAIIFMVALMFCPVSLAAAPRQLIIGVAAHMLRPGYNYKQAIDEIANMGATSVRFDAPWQIVEKQKGKLHIPPRWDAIINAANKKHIRVLLILDYGNRAYQGGGKPKSKQAIKAFVRYASFVANHFKGRVNLYEVWNEWDGTVGHSQPGTATEYVALLKPTYKTLKAISPTIRVLGGAVTAHGIHHGYLNDLIEAGALRYMDGLSIHPYYYCKRRFTTSDWADWMRNIEKKLAAHAGAQVPIYITEIGWPNSIGKCGTTPENQAKMLYNTVMSAHALGFIRGIWWYNLHDNGTNPYNRKNRYGLFTKSGTSKPASSALTNAIRALNNIKK